MADFSNGTYQVRFCVDDGISVESYPVDDEIVEQEEGFYSLYFYPSTPKGELSLPTVVAEGEHPEILRAWYDANAVQPAAFELYRNNE